MRKDCLWLHVDATHGSFNAMRADAAARHGAAAPGCELSVTRNAAGTEALVKVAGGRDWTPGWLNAPFVKRVYTSEDHHQIASFIYGPDWQEPEPMGSKPGGRA